MYRASSEGSRKFQNHREGLYEACAKIITYGWLSESMLTKAPVPHDLSIGISLPLTYSGLTPVQHSVLIVY